MNERLEDFRVVVQRHYQRHGRHDLPWRMPDQDGGFDPYKILVSEIMLQQTQVARVIPKYRQFLERFPSFADLAAAPLGEVLRIWSGLGYNRRAKFLWECAKRVVSEHGGRLPKTTAELVKLPGIGASTAGAVFAYASNKPAVFIETNIRTVFIHHFFAGQQGVSDQQIVDLIRRTLPDNPRTWYWALMDYGSHLKQTVGNLNTASKHYTKQSRFEGSKRQIRGQVLRLLGERQRTLRQLQTNIPDERLTSVLGELNAEGFIAQSSRYYHLT